MKMHAYIDGMGLLAPGLAGWEESKKILSAVQKYHPQELEKIIISVLQPNERRRTTQLIKLALKVAQEAANNSMVSASDYHTVFAASDGDHAVIDNICKTLTDPDHPVSPTYFHNSVHNAPAGYWAIAAQATLSSTSISACNESFSSGLIEAVSIVDVERIPVLLVAYDYPPPIPLFELRDIKNAFAVAMVLTPEKCAHSMASIQLTLGEGENISKCSNRELETLRLDNPVARSIPLLQLLASEKEGEVNLLAVQNRCLRIQVQPCQQ